MAVSINPFICCPSFCGSSVLNNFNAGPNAPANFSPAAILSWSNIETSWSQPNDAFVDVSFICLAILPPAFATSLKSFVNACPLSLISEKKASPAS